MEHSLSLSLIGIQLVIQTFPPPRQRFKGKDVSCSESGVGE